MFKHNDIALGYGRSGKEIEIQGKNYVQSLAMKKSLFTSFGEHQSIEILIS